MAMIKTSKSRVVGEIAMANKPHETVERLLTIEETAATCQVSIKTVRRWIDSTELPAAKLGAQWRIRPKDLAHFISDRLTR
jgi:excisionase family DNA binding protein